MTNTTVAAILVLGTVLAVFASERITAPPNTGDVIHVTYWEKWSGFERDAMQTVVDQYNRTQGKAKHIFVDFTSTSGIEQKTLVAAAGGDPPDIAGLQTIDVAPFADDLAILPLDKLCREYGIQQSAYVPVYWKQVFYRGHIYALPTTPASVALHYNKTLFAEAGLDPNDPPQTIEELDADAAKLTKKSGGEYTQMGFLPGDPGWWNYGWGYFFGGSLWNGRDRITCNSPDNVRAFTWIASYSHLYGPNAESSLQGGVGNFASPQNPFIAGKLAMELQGVWMYNFINRFNPQLQWGACPFPYPADRPDLKDTTIADSDNLVIPVGAKHPKEAFDFIAYVEQQHNLEELCLLQRKHSPLVKVSRWFLANSPNPYISIFNDLPKNGNARTPPMMAIFRQYQDELSTAFDEVSLLKETPQEALDEVHDRMQPLLDRYNRIMRARQAAGQ